MERSIRVARRVGRPAIVNNDSSRVYKLKRAAGLRALIDAICMSLIGLFYCVPLLIGCVVLNLILCECSADFWNCEKRSAVSACFI